MEPPLGKLREDPSSIYQELDWKGGRKAHLFVILSDPSSGGTFPTRLLPVPLNGVTDALTIHDRWHAYLSAENSETYFSSGSPEFARESYNSLLTTAWPPPPPPPFLDTPSHTDDCELWGDWSDELLTTTL